MFSPGPVCMCRFPQQLNIWRVWDVFCYVSMCVCLRERSRDSAAVFTSSTRDCSWVLTCRWCVCCAGVHHDEQHTAAASTAGEDVWSHGRREGATWLYCCLDDVALAVLSRCVHVQLSRRDHVTLCVIIWRRPKLDFLVTRCARAKCSLLSKHQLSFIQLFCGTAPIQRRTDGRTDGQTDGRIQLT